jgi:hypothetical protein
MIAAMIPTAQSLTDGIFIAPLHRIDRQARR